MSDTQTGELIAWASGAAAVALLVGMLIALLAAWWRNRD